MSWFKKPKYTSLKKPVGQRRIPQGLWVKCPACMEAIVSKEWARSIQVCPKCGHHDRLTPAQRLDHLLDEGSFTEIDSKLVSGDVLTFKDEKNYPDRLNQAREKTNQAEAVVSGYGKIRGKGVAIAVMDMGFIGGSMGVAVGEKIARTMERGLKHRLPVILVCGSGGARMQEGIFSLMQMAKTSAIAARLSEASIPLFTVLTDPTTGGVTASFASLGDVVLAEPNALVGFAGPRVIEATIKQILPPGFQRAEFVAEHGFIDIVCPRIELRPTIHRLFSQFMHAQWEREREATQIEEVQRRAYQQAGHG